VNAFDRHMPIQKLVVGEVNRTLAARAKLAVDHIAFADYRSLNVGLHSYRPEQRYAKTQAAIFPTW
jgi:hypothetical protein